MATPKRSSKAAVIAQLFQRNITNSAAIIDEENANCAKDLSSDSNNDLDEENVLENSSDSRDASDEESPPLRRRRQATESYCDILIAPSGQKLTSISP